MENTLSIVNKTKGKLPSLPLVALKDDILGKKYVLSLAFVDEKTSKKINREYRGKNKPTNVLSFSLSKNEGEIILCPTIIKKETGKFEKNFKDLLGFLVIHGMLHLKGHEHSSKLGEEKMVRAENKYDQKYFNRNRRGLSDDKGRGGRISKRRKIS